MELEEYRQQIDTLDTKIISLLANRIEICKKVANYKKKQNIPMMQPDRVNQVIERCVRLGTQLNLSGTVIENIYRLIIAETCRIEDGIIQE